jgi:uncharacterized membrane protein YsdA (DUF1294 family)
VPEDIAKKVFSTTQFFLLILIGGWFGLLIAYFYLRKNPEEIKNFKKAFTYAIIWSVIWSFLIYWFIPIIFG